MSKRYIRRSAKQWASIIDQQASSGLRVKDFCKQRKLVPSTFCNWKQKLQAENVEQPKPSSSKAPAFQPMEIVPSESGASGPATRISLTLDEGITLTIEREIRIS